MTDKCRDAYDKWSANADWENYAGGSQNDVAEDAFEAGWKAAKSTPSVNQELVEKALEYAEIGYNGGFVDETLRPTLSTLCEMFGYGNVMASASRLWRDKDPIGAHSTGMCYGTLKPFIDKCKQALSPQQPY